MNVSKIALAMTCLLFAVGADAGWFSGSKDKTQRNVVMPPNQTGKAQPTSASGRALMRRAHLHFDDAKAEQEFLAITSAKRRVQEDFQVITRLLQEKNLEVEKFTRDLESEFNINPDANYHYDDDAATIYELTRNASVAGDAETLDPEKDFDRKEHLKLDTEDRKTRFLRLVASKKLSSDEINILRLLQNEKEIEASNIQQQLVARYAITSDREYRYEKSTRTLYELVPVPAGTASVTNPAQEAVTK
ncbi:MAG: hypothetical protein V1929_07940 [bacterium]